MRRGLFLLSFLPAVFLISCSNFGDRVDGNGNIKSETRDIRIANRIKVTGDMDVIILQGTAAVRVEADENLLPFIETVADDNWLEIKSRDNFDLRSSKTIRVYVTTPEITDVKLTGSGNITTQDKFSFESDINFDITGSGNITAQINTPKVEAHISGSGNLHLSGETKDMEISISGSGNFRGSNLKAENADLSIAGSGDADVFVDDRMKVSVAGSGNVKYNGNATIDSHISGSGSVSKSD